MHTVIKPQHHGANFHTKVYSNTIDWR